jgi:lipopolysaccharide transport system ATP-binding protein
MPIVISVEHLSKAYRLGQIGTGTLSHDLNVWWAKVRGKPNPLLHIGETDHGNRDGEELWALRDVSFTVEQGEVLGIIGRNGAGKSTLLKILSHITAPTEGRIKLKGRVASLLEVGTGFHPELTGRENIYLNGSILGMSRKEIDRKFDEIVDFAEIEKFIDTPVKRYSSGMYVRLAFAVAAHLEPEILLVDEVLAVGDAEFQKKCLGKMSDVAKEGRTVLFVSHNMNSIEQLCTRVLLLNSGQLIRDDQNVRSSIIHYLFNDREDKAEWKNPGNQFENEWFVPERFFLTDISGKVISAPVRNDENIWVNIEGIAKMNDPALTIGYAIYSEDGTLLYWSYQTDQDGQNWIIPSAGKCCLKSQLPKRFLNEGEYKLELIGGLHFRKWLFQPGGNVPTIAFAIQGGLSDSPLWVNRRPGLLAPVIRWTNDD